MSNLQKGCYMLADEGRAGLKFGLLAVSQDAWLATTTDFGNRGKLRCLRCRSGLVGLPEEVLAAILGHLRHMPSLMVVRLVCRLLRKVSYSVITKLMVDTEASVPDLQRQRRGRLTPLEALPYLTKVRLHGRLLDRRDLLALPRFAQLLRELDLRSDYCPSPAVEEFCAKVKSARGITALTWLDYTGINSLLPFLLTNWPQLACLVVRIYVPFPAAVRDAILQLTGLCTLILGHRQEQLWADLLPRLQCLPRLKHLGAVPVNEEAAVKGIAALSQLTGLQIFGRGSVSALGALTRLSALEALKVELVRITDDDADFAIFKALPRGMSQLTELTVEGKYSFAGFGDVMATLKRLAVFHHGSPGSYESTCPVGSLREAPLQGLRQLSLHRLGEGSPCEMRAVFSALTGLESLSLELACRATGNYVYTHLPQLTRLTLLRVDGGWPPMAPVPASAFLTGLTGLEDLTLRYVLSKHNGEADIRCLALLTRLQRLRLTSADYYPPRVGSSGAQVLKPADLDRSNLEPLRALRWLEAWDLNNAWRMPRGRRHEPDAVVRDMFFCPGYTSRQSCNFRRRCSWISP